MLITVAALHVLKICLTILFQFFFCTNRKLIHETEGHVKTDGINQKLSLLEMAIPCQKFSL